jgi:glucose-6-phosphate isomerase
VVEKDAMSDLWTRYQKYLAVCPTIDLIVDISRMRFDDGFFERMQPSMAAAFVAMAELERGAIANPDENRMVGHYWLRNPALAKTTEIRDEITTTNARLVKFASDVHQGVIVPERAPRFRNFLVIGIGGSALGPEFVAAALGTSAAPMRPYFFDNTDPDGIDRTLAAIGEGIRETLTIVISKSGGTKETRNGMLEAREAYQRAGLAFAKHAVAVTGDGSELDKTAKQSGWIATFPMWDWVGGRTSELSAVGLLPAALQGIDVEAMLAGARDADVVTRADVVAENPAALLALMWHHAGGGQGKKAMVVLPYKDQLELFSRYLQQLVMESLGKEKDLKGRVVNQGLTVYGNKGSTDQHAYVQQLRDGLNNFFVTFIRVLGERKGRTGPPFEVEPEITSSDYLEGFLLGTRQALYENARESVTLTLSEVSPRSIGVLIAVYERAVGLYASLIGINAYHQPGVEAGKKAAANVIALKAKVMRTLREAKEPLTAQQIAEGAGAPAEAETVHHLLVHLSSNRGRGVERVTTGASASASAAKAALLGAKFKAE